MGRIFHRPASGFMYFKRCFLSTNHILPMWGAIGHFLIKVHLLILLLWVKIHVDGGVASGGHAYTRTAREKITIHRSDWEMQEYVPLTLVQCIPNSTCNRIPKMTVTTQKEKEHDGGSQSRKRWCSELLQVKYLTFFNCIKHMTKETCCSGSAQRLRRVCEEPCTYTPLASWQ